VRFPIENGRISSRIRRNDIFFTLSRRKREKDRKFGLFTRAMRDVSASLLPLFAHPFPILSSARKRFRNRDGDFKNGSAFFDNNVSELFLFNATNGVFPSVESLPFGIAASASADASAIPVSNARVKYSIGISEINARITRS